MERREPVCLSQMTVSEIQKGTSLQRNPQSVFTGGSLCAVPCPPSVPCPPFSVQSPDESDSSADASLGCLQWKGAVSMLSVVAQGDLCP